MGLIDRNSKSRVYKDGSSKIDAGLTEAQALEVFGSGATAGWYRTGFMAGGTIGRDGNSQKVYDEAGEAVASTSTSDDFLIANTTQMTDAQSLKLYEFLETNEVPVRYILPTPDPDVVQVHYHPAMTKDEGSDQISTSKGVRTMQFTLRGKRSLRVFDDVATDQSDWAAAGLGDAMDTVFAPA